MAENSVLKFEIGDMKANIKDTTTKLFELEQETEDLNVKVKQIMFEFNKYKEFDCEFKTLKARFKLIKKENDQLKEDIKELNLHVKICIEKKIS